MDWLQHFPKGWLENLQILAMHESVVGTDAGYLRSIYRWYSSEFHTPLHLVDELPIEDVLTHFFEHHYDEMNDQQKDVEIRRLLMTPEQLKAAKLAEDTEDAEATEIAKMEPAPVETAPVLDPVLERLKQVRGQIPGTEVALPEIDMDFKDLEEDAVP